MEYLPAKASELLIKILHQHLAKRQVMLFGSRATGNARPSSDADLVIMGDEPLTPQQRTDLQYAFEESDLPFRVDVIEWSNISEEFRQCILPELKPLYP